MSRRIAWGRVISGTVGYGIASAVVTHFLLHREPFSSGDLILAAFGMMGLQLGIGKSIVEMLEAFTQFVGTARSGWAARTGRTMEQPALVRQPTPVVPILEAKKRKRPPKGSIAHRSSAKGKPKRARGRSLEIEWVGHAGRSQARINRSSTAPPCRFNALPRWLSFG